MKWYTKFFAAIAILLGFTVLGAPVAGATPDAQPVNCEARVLDVTAQQGIDTTFLHRQIDMLREIYPAADVYVQAYESLPAEILNDDFSRQCANWRDATGSRLKDNALLVIYANNLQDIKFYAGHGFEAGIGNHHMASLRNDIDANLQPDIPELHTDYRTTALAQAVMGTRTHLRLSNLYSYADGLYHAPVSDDTSDGYGYVETDWKEVGGMIVLVAIGFTIFGLLLWVMGSVLKRLRR